MQRAAASSSPAPTEDPATPSPKRQRLSTTNSDSAPSPRQPISDLEAIQAALAAEEQKRADAIARQAAEAGETNWVLSFGEDSARTTTPFSVVASATAQPMIIAADSLDAEEQDASHDGGRKCYGGFKSRNRKVVVSFNSMSRNDEMSKLPANRCNHCSSKTLKRPCLQIQRSLQHTCKKRKEKPS